MAKKGFLSSTNSGKSLQLNNFALKFPTYKTIFGFSSADQTSAENDAKAWQYGLDVQRAYQTAGQSTTNYFNLLRDGSAAPIGAFPTGTILLPTPTPTVVLAGIVPRFLEMAHVAKAKKSVYTVAYGEDWGIEGPDSGIIEAFLKPDIKITVQVDLPILHVRRIIGYTVDFYKAVGESTTFDFFGNSDEATFTDTAPLPAGVNVALVHYKAIYKKGSTHVGQISEQAAVALVRPV